MACVKKITPLDLKSFECCSLVSGLFKDIAWQKFCSYEWCLFEGVLLRKSMVVKTVQNYKPCWPSQILSTDMGFSYCTVWNNVFLVTIHPSWIREGNHTRLNVIYCKKQNHQCKIMGICTIFCNKVQDRFGDHGGEVFFFIVPCRVAWSMKSINMS